MGTTNRQKLRAAITQTGKVLADVAADDVSRLAIELSSRFPQSGLTIDTIEEEIRTAGRERSELKAEAVG
jgi:hypothetical protein